MNARGVIVGFSFTFALACGGAAPPEPIPASAATPADAPPTADWDGMSTYECGAMASRTLKGVKANVASGPAISASGMCELVLVDVELVGAVGIDASGQVRVTMRGGRIDAKTAVQASGESVVVLEGVEVKGEIAKSGLAKVEQSGTAAPASAAPAPAAGSAANSGSTGTTSAKSGTSAKSSAAKAAEDAKWACDQAFSRCKDDASYANSTCRSACSADGSCDAACDACKEACDDVYDEAYSACDRAWQSCG